MNLTVGDFIDKILKQCMEVYDSHELKTKEDYLADGTYSTLEKEMVEVKVCEAQNLREIHTTLT
jgi:SepF-like predicted cell division protein (DUF552 family)